MDSPRSADNKPVVGQHANPFQNNQFSRQLRDVNYHCAVEVPRRLRFADFIPVIFFIIGLLALMLWATSEHVWATL